MVVGASITVNTSRTDGEVETGASSEETRILKQILLELKTQNRQSLVANRKAESGFGGKGGVGGAGGLLRLLGGLSTVGAGGIMGGAAGAGHILDSLFPNLKNPTTTHNFAKVQGETGGEQIAKMDSITGEIVDILTIEEAERMGILDKLGNVKESVENHNVEQKSILGTLEKSGDTYILTNTALNDIYTEILQQKEYDKNISYYKKVQRDAQKKIAERMAREANINVSDIRTTSDAVTSVNNESRAPGPFQPRTPVTNYDALISPAQAKYDDHLETAKRNGEAAGYSFVSDLFGGFGR